MRHQVADAVFRATFKHVDDVAVFAVYNLFKVLGNVLHGGVALGEVGGPKMTLSRTAYTAYTAYTAHTAYTAYTAWFQTHHGFRHSMISDTAYTAWFQTQHTQHGF